MYRVVVRSRRDARAVEAALDRFMPGWGVRVETLGGARGSRLAEAILASAGPLTVFLLGREDEGAAREALAGLPPLTALVVTRGARVRNNTVESLYHYLGRGRSFIRLHASWLEERRAYLLSPPPASGGLEGLEYPLLGDNFFLYGRGARLLSVFLMRSVGGLALLVKDKGGRHLVYSGPRLVGEVFMEDDAPVPRGRPRRGVPGARGSLEATVEENRGVLDALESTAVEWLHSNAPDPDTVLVPWSGGKDSTAALLVAIAAYGRSSVTAVYVDTGIDFPENREYVEELASRLGVDLVVEEAGVDRGLLEEGMPLPNPEDRWCTGRKLEALRRAFRREARGKTIVVTGDRDAESGRRYKRPPARRDQETGLPLLAPLKPWGGGHVQLYILSRGLPLNPLYEAGFYRIGCYICYSLRSWELNVMKRAGVLDSILARRPGHRVLVEAFLEAKRRGRLRGGERDCVCTI